MKSNILFSSRFVVPILILATMQILEAPEPPEKISEGEGGSQRKPQQEGEVKEPKAINETTEGHLYVSEQERRAVEPRSVSDVVV